jgi:hypothetical protein
MAIGAWSFIALLPTLLIFLLSLCLLFAKAVVYVSEFIMRRIAESPKGPVFAISALAGGIAAIVKAFR